VKTNLGGLLIAMFGENWAVFIERLLAFTIIWLTLLWLYRRKVFIKI